MPRPNVPEAEKRRTVPFRMNHLDYRTLTLLLYVTDTTIQEHLRAALNAHLERKLKELREQVDFHIPSSYDLGAWSDDAFNAWLKQIGSLAPKQKAQDKPKVAPARRGLRTTPVAVQRAA